MIQLTQVNEELLTPAEYAVLEELAKAWTKFLELPEETQDGRDEFRHGIHALEYQIMARAACRGTG